MSPRLFTQVVILGGLVALVLACITAAVIVTAPEWLPTLGNPPETPVTAQTFTPVPTFTLTPTPLPLSPTFTLTPTPLSPTPPPTATPTTTPTATSSPPVAEALSVEASPPPLPPTLPADPPTPTRPTIDFIVAQQRMRSNAENSWEEVIANGCGSDHTIYVTVVDAAGTPLNGVLVGDTYDNVRAVSGAAGLGKLEIELWSNTMVLTVKQIIDAEAAYTSEQTLPLSTRDEDIPAQWLFEGGYCPSVAECELRQQTNGLCRGHYSYDVVFQRTW